MSSTSPSVYKGAAAYHGLAFAVLAKPFSQGLWGEKVNSCEATFCLRKGLRRGNSEESLITGFASAHSTQHTALKELTRHQDKAN